MRTIETKLYKFEELSEEAKQVALENYRNNENSGQSWQEENLESIKHGLIAFGYELTNWEIEYYCATSAYTSIDSRHDEEIEELSGIRLRTYLLNNYYWNLYQRKTWHFCRNEDGTRRMNCVGLNSGKYVSKVQFENSSCPFTGYCGDENFLDPIREFINNPTNITFTELMKEAVQAGLKLIEDDYEHQMTEEFFAEECDSNDYEFTEDGNRY